MVANGGVCQRPAGTSAPASKRHPCVAHRLAKSVVFASSAWRARSRTARSGLAPASPTSTPASSNASRIAHARSARSASSAAPSTGTPTSPGSVLPPMNASRPGMNGTASLRRTQNVSRPSPSPRINTTAAEPRKRGASLMRRSLEAAPGYAPMPRPSGRHRHVPDRRRITELRHPVVEGFEHVHVPHTVGRDAERIVQLAMPFGNRIWPGARPKGPPNTRSSAGG